MEKFKAQEETYYLDNTTILPCEIVFTLIVRRYNVVSSKSEHKHSPKTLSSLFCSVRIHAKVILQEFTLQSCAKYIGNLLGFTENADLK